MCYGGGLCRTTITFNVDFLCNGHKYLTTNEIKNEFIYMFDSLNKMIYLTMLIKVTFTMFVFYRGFTCRVVNKRKIDVVFSIGF